MRGELGKQKLSGSDPAGRDWIYTGRWYLMALLCERYAAVFRADMKGEPS